MKKAAELSAAFFCPQKKTAFRFLTEKTGNSAFCVSYRKKRKRKRPFPENSARGGASFCDLFVCGKKRERAFVFCRFFFPAGRTPVNATRGASGFLSAGAFFFCFFFGFRRDSRPHAEKLPAGGLILSDPAKISHAPALASRRPLCYNEKKQRKGRKKMILRLWKIGVFLLLLSFFSLRAGAYTADGGEVFRVVLEAPQHGGEAIPAADGGDAGTVGPGHPVAEPVIFHVAVQKASPFSSGSCPGDSH